MRLYDLLLRLYPASFRDEYAEEMRPIFARQRRESRGPGTVWLWLRTIADVLINAAASHAAILKQDLSYALRLLRRSPGFAITACLVAALGIGATTAAFSVADVALFRPLPFPDSDRLVKIWATTPGYSRMELSAPNYRDMMAAARSYVSTGVYHGEKLTLVTRGEPRMLQGASVSAGLLPTIGVAPMIGRTFSPEDDRPGAPPTVIFSFALWQTEFGGDPFIVGRTVVLGDAPHTVIGVMPQTFHFPESDTTFWVTNRFGERAYVDEQRTNNWLDAVGRLRPGVTLAEARAEMDVIAARLREAFPRENRDTGATVITMRAEMSERSRLLLLALLGAALCLLLIACANLANLLLARALGRRRELAVRASLGAGRDRLVRQLLTESLLLAAIGGAAGIGLAIASVPLLAQLVPPTLPIAATPSVDGRVLLVAIGLTLLTGIAFGLAPVLRGGRVDLDGLRDGPRAGGGRREPLRAALVIAEIAACVTLLAVTGLLIRALVTVQRIDPGFTPEGVLTLRSELPMPEYASVAKREAFYAQVLQELRALPGVTSAGFVSFLPMSSFRGGIWEVAVDGESNAGAGVRSADRVASIRYVTPGYFEAMSIPIRLGRDVSTADRRDGPALAVVSESFVRRHWPGEHPIGRRFTFAFAEREVVGVVGDVRFRGLERQSEPQVYLPSAQVDDGAITFYAPRALALRTSRDPASLAPDVRAIVHRAAPRVPITELRTLTDLVGLETASRTTQVRIVSLFAIVAFVLAAVGIHGLLSFTVSRRTQEIGVRMALGAGRGAILSMMVRRALLLGSAGVIPGIVLAWIAGRSIEALLAGVRPADAPTLAAAVGFAVLMTLLGSLAPTLRAVRVDPSTALRSE